MRHLPLTRLTLALGLVAGLAALGGPPARAADQTARHPLGLSFRHPEEWQVGTASGLMVLVPPDLATSAGEPQEFYLLQAAARPADMIGADDPRVAAALEAKWARELPFLKRTGEPERVETGLGPGAALAWEGADESGTAVSARAFTAAGQNFTFQLVGVGLQEKVAAREETLRAIFASFAAAEPERDPALAGFWRFAETSSLVSGDFTAATLHRVELQLAPDGTGFITETSRVVGDPGDTGEQPHSTPMQWFAGDGILCLFAADGSFAALQYELQAGAGGRSLTVRSEGGQPRTYAEVGE